MNFLLNDIFRKTKNVMYFFMVFIKKFEKVNWFLISSYEL